MDFSALESPRRAVVIVGGAVAGSEAAAVCLEHGLWPIVIEQNAHPYGKIEDGLPRWHEKLRALEMETIAGRLNDPRVTFVPSTRLGEHVSLDELANRWGACVVLLASGAWRDRPLFVGAHEFLGRGLMLQNALVADFNQTPDEAHTSGALDDALVVGGGLASIDVVKLLRIQAWQALLRGEGRAASATALEREGAPEGLAGRGPTIRLIYRRQKVDMPLSPLAADATPAQRQKAGEIRTRLVDKVLNRFEIAFEPGLSVKAPVVKEGRLAGLVFAGGDGQDVVLHAPRVVSAIGSIPEPLPGVPMRGELLDVEDAERGRLRGFANVYALGNAVTGKGNIKDSRHHAENTTRRVLRETLEPDPFASAHERARERAERVVAECAHREPLTQAEVDRLTQEVQGHWTRTGYTGDLTAWLAR